MGNTILIAEDEKLYLKILGRLFSKQGFTVHTADNCRDALDLAARHLPDCFLLDYNMGAEGSIEPVCRFIRSHPRLQRAPILILSGEYEKASECYNTHEVDLFIKKCSPLLEIAAAVKRQLRRAATPPPPQPASDLALDREALRVLPAGREPVELSRDQFLLLSLLMEASPSFVSDEQLCRRILDLEPDACACKALNMTIYRLRQKLGRRLARRIKNSRSLGWTYVQPRPRGTA